MKTILFSERMRIGTAAYEKALDDMETHIQKKREELLRIRPTNFNVITEFPEKLAEFIDEAIERAVKDVGGRGCPIYEKPECKEGISCVQCITRWLKQKAEDKNESVDR